MVKWLAVGAVAALAGVNLLLVAAVLALTAWLPAWLAAVGLGAALLVLGAAVGWVGWTRRVTTPLALTRKTLREDLQWARERLV